MVTMSLEVLPNQKDYQTGVYLLQSKQKKILLQVNLKILENSAKVRIMGSGIFEHLSRALDNSLKVTQGFMILCTGIFLLSIFLWF